MILDTFFNESNLFGSEAVNENYVDQIEAIPLNENEHPVDACFRLTLENEQNWYNIFNTIAVSEMAFLESHGENDVMYEAVDVKKIANTVVQWIQTQFAKLKGVFEKAIKSIADALNQDKRIIKAIKDKNVDLNQKVKVAQGRKIWNANVSAGEIPAIFSDQIGITTNKYVTLNEGKSKEYVESMKKEWAEKKATILNDVRGNILKQIGSYSGGGCEQKDFLKKLGEVMLTEVKEGGATYDLKTFYNKIKDGTSKSELDKAFSSVKDSFNKMIKEAKDVQKNANKSGENYELIVDICGLKTEVIKSHISIITSGSGAVIRAVGTDYATARAILKNSISSTKKPEKEKKKAVGESAIEEDIICTII